VVMEIYQCRLAQKFGGQTTKSPDHKIPVLMGVSPSVPVRPGNAPGNAPVPEMLPEMLRKCSVPEMLRPGNAPSRKCSVPEMLVPRPGNAPSRKCSGRTTLTASARVSRQFLQLLAATASLPGLLLHKESKGRHWW
jgi:hypothetical protein